MIIRKKPLLTGSEMMKTEEIVFQIILYAGNARSFSMEAISLAKKQQIEEAKEKIEEAKKEVSQAHTIQTDLISKESKGEQTEVTLLLVHAQDHFMNAITVNDLAKEFVDLYENVGKLNGVKSS